MSIGIRNNEWEWERVEQIDWEKMNMKQKKVKIIDIKVWKEVIRNTREWSKWERIIFIFKEWKWTKQDEKYKKKESVV